MGTSGALSEGRLTLRIGCRAAARSDKPTWPTLAEPAWRNPTAAPWQLHAVARRQSTAETASTSRDLVFALHKATREVPCSDVPKADVLVRGAKERDPRANENWNPCNDKPLDEAGA